MTTTEIRAFSVDHLQSAALAAVREGYRLSDARTIVDTGTIQPTTRYALVTYFRADDGATVQIELDLD